MTPWTRIQQRVYTCKAYILHRPSRDDICYVRTAALSSYHGSSSDSSDAVLAQEGMVEILEGKSKHHLTMYAASHDESFVHQS